MNCEKCLAQIDEYSSGLLAPRDCAALELHLENCGDCAAFQTDLLTILDACDDLRVAETAPPNPQAMWLRISNTIECEQMIAAVAESKAQAATVQPQGWWTRTMETSWRLSLQQMVSAVLGIAVITSLLTFVSLKNSNHSGSNFLAGFWQNGEGEKTGKTSNRGLELENRLKQQQLAIEYWNQRVAARRNQWNAGLRAAFDRNLNEIDAVVADYKFQLQVDPDDSISEEMLDAALKDKMELLREFSEL